MDNPFNLPRKLAAGLLVTAVSISAFVWQPAVLAAEQGKGDHADVHAEAAKYPSVGAAWAAVQEGIKTIEGLTAQKNLKPIHEAEQKITGALKYLAANSTMVTADKATRLKPALSQAIKLADSVHHASDAGDQAKTESEFKKLKGALKLVEAQYPAEALQAK